MTKYTDDQFLLNCFDIIIHKQNSLEAQLTGDLSYWFRDGFEEKIDEGMLSPFLIDLAARCGYLLVDGMWVDKKSFEDQKQKANNLSLLDMMNDKSQDIA